MKQQHVCQLQGLIQLCSPIMKNTYFQPYWEILQYFTHIPSFKPPRTQGGRKLGTTRVAAVFFWWRHDGNAVGFYQFYSSEDCTQMYQYVPWSTSDIQTKECVKLYGGSWKYPDLWKRQTRKAKLPLEMMRDIVKTWILTWVCTHVHAHALMHTHTNKILHSGQNHQCDKNCEVWRVSCGRREPDTSC